MQAQLLGRQRRREAGAERRPPLCSAPVTTKALTLLDGAARLQASVLAFNDTFRVTALVVLAAIPLVLLLGKPKVGVKVDAGAH